MIFRRGGGSALSAQFGLWDVFAVVIPLVHLTVIYTSPPLHDWETINAIN